MSLHTIHLAKVAQTLSNLGNVNDSIFAREPGCNEVAIGDGAFAAGDRENGLLI